MSDPMCDGNGECFRQEAEIESLRARLTAVEAERERLEHMLEVAEDEATECWSALSFNWDTMPADLRLAARDTVRDALYALGTRLRAALRGHNIRECAAPVKSRAELLEAQLTAAEALRDHLIVERDRLKEENEALRRQIATPKEPAELIPTPPMCVNGHIEMQAWCVACVLLHKKATP